MTKERLEELIKQGAKIYYNSYDENLKCNPGELDLSKCFMLFDDVTDTESHWCFSPRELFETKEQALWHDKTYTERTERFEPPMWEEIKDTYEFHFTCQNYTHKRTDGIIETVYTPQCFMFYVHKSEQPNCNRVMIRNYRVYALNIEVFDEPATKENYEKACEIVRDLFKGEK